MAFGSLLTLLDDIATLLDDIAVTSKMAAQKTVGVLGDDLAVNAEQVSGVKADRELPVVFAVAKGSLLNKCIIVPIILLLSALLPWVITPMLMVGGLYLCFEGGEKVWHKLTHEPEHNEQSTMQDKSASDLVAYEQAKIKGAIRTDAILSLEIVVIALGTVQEQPFMTQALTVSLVAIALTLLVYGAVAVIVKIDDVGLFCAKRDGVLKAVGRGLLWLAPALMKLLTIGGTIAMFLVGGGIFVHGLEHYIPSLAPHLIAQGNDKWQSLAGLGVNASVGVLVAIVLVTVVNFSEKLFKR